MRKWSHDGSQGDSRVKYRGSGVCHVSVDIMEKILNIFRRFRDCNFRAISQPNVKNKRSYFASKNNILGKNELWLSTWESRE